MSAVQAERRKRVVLRLALVAAVLLALTLFTGRLGRDARPPPDRTGAPVFSGFSEARDDVAAIRVTLADDRYTLERGEDGWVMVENGGYPVRSDRLLALSDGLEGALWGEARTRDPAKFDRIGLGDPLEGGTGALIEALDEDGGALFALVSGRKAGRLYGRRPQDQVAYRIEGDLPPLYTREAWLDFAIAEIDAAAIRAVRLTDATGARLLIRRGAGEGPRGFRPGPPDAGRRLANPLSGAAAGLAMARFAPLDAKPAANLSTQPVGRHVSMTFDGLEIAAEAHREPDGFYLTLRAVEAGEGARRANSINDKADGWAFRVSDYDFADFTPRVADILAPPPAPPEEDG